VKFELKHVGKPRYNMTISRHKQRYVKKKLNLIIRENGWELKYICTTYLILF